MNFLYQKRKVIVLFILILGIYSFVGINRPKIIFISSKEHMYLGKISDEDWGITKVRTRNHQYQYNLPIFLSSGEIVFFYQNGAEMFDLNVLTACEYTLTFDDQKNIVDFQEKSNWLCLKAW